MEVKRKLYNLIRPKKSVELISIHIPKTAGTSLKNILQSQYSDAVEFLYHDNLGKNKLLKKGLPIKLNHRGVRCLHGHFPAKLNLKEFYPNAKIITWMRDPVERMISTYNYYKTLPLHHNKVHAKFITENWDIIDLSKILRDETQSYLNEFKLEDFDFIGFTEYQQKSLVSLSKMMNWNEIDITMFSNVSPKMATFNFETREKLKEILKEEIVLYERAQKLFAPL
jgi:hypothetical protein